MPLDNSVVSLFNQMAGTFAAADANVGEGLQGEWPPEGLSDNVVLGVTCKPGTMPRKNPDKSDSGSKAATVEVQFEYETVADSKSPDFDPTKPPLVWKGEVFRLVPNYGTTLAEKGQQTAARIAEERFKGHCSKILRRSPAECTNPAVLIQEILALCESSRPVVLTKIVHRTNPQKPGAVYKTEFIQDRLG